MLGQGGREGKKRGGKKHMQKNDLGTQNEIISSMQYFHKI